MGGSLNFGGLGNWSLMAALGKRKAVKSPSPSSSSGSSSGEELEEEEAVVNGHEGGSGSEELDSDVSGSEEEEEDGGGELNTSSDSDHSSQPSQVFFRSNCDMGLGFRFSKIKWCFIIMKLPSKWQLMVPHADVFGL